MQKVTMEIWRDVSAADLALPTYQSIGASGMDVCAAVTAPVELGAGKIALIPTGLKIAVPVGYEVQVRPRSGLALKHGIIVVNSPGTIDADYRGLVGIILGNFSDKTFVINRGERIAQLVVQSVVQAEIVVVEKLSETERGSGGFGSTGK